MKKFWNLMLVALVIMGAAACTATDENIDVKSEESVSFYATFGDDDTRAYIDDTDGDKTWETIWESGDMVYVQADGGAAYTFTYDAAIGKFSCSEDGVTSLIGNNVIVFSHDLSVNDSKAGKKAWDFGNTLVENFTNDSYVTLRANTSYFRYTYDGDGEIMLEVKVSSESVAPDPVPYVFRYENGFYETITFSGVKGENFVGFWTQNFDPVEATLAYYIDGVKCKETELTLRPGKIYNLGTLTEPAPEYELSAYSVPGSHNEWTIGQTPMYIVGDYCVAFDVTFAAEGAFKVFGNDQWIGVNNLTVGKWTAAGVDHIDAYVPAGTYDIYYSEADSKVCVVEAGEEVPAMPVFSIGVVGLGGNWDVDIDMTLEGEYYTLKGVAIAATDTFKLRISDDWAENYGIASSDTAEAITIDVDAMYTLVQDGKNMQVAAGTYDLYFDYETKRFYVLTAGTTPDDLNIPQYKIYVYQYNNAWSTVNLYTWDTLENKYTGGWPGSATTATETINGYEYLVWTMDRAATGATLNVILNDGTAQTSDFALGQLNKDYYLLLNGTALSLIEDPENPEPKVVEGEPQPSTWALSGDFNSWGEQVMYTTDTANVFVATNVKITAYQKLKVKEVGNWNKSYGGGFQYLNANSYMTVYSGGGDIAVVTAGTYDVYFDYANTSLYVVTAGADRSSAVKQTTEGPAPDLLSSSWGLCGTHNSWGSNDTPLVWDGTISMYVAKSVTLTGEFKVRADKSWSTNYGSGNTITVNASAGTTVFANGGNCKVASGTYDVYFDLAAKKVWVKTPGSAAPTK